VADTLRVDVGERPEQLVDVQLDFKYRHSGFHLVEISGCAVHGLGNKFEDEVKVNLVFLNHKISISSLKYRDET